MVLCLRARTRREAARAAASGEAVPRLLNRVHDDEQVAGVQDEASPAATSHCLNAGCGGALAEHAWRIVVGGAGVLGGQRQQVELLVQELRLLIAEWVQLRVVAVERHALEVPQNVELVERGHGQVRRHLRYLTL